MSQSEYISKCELRIHNSVFCSLGKFTNQTSVNHSSSVCNNSLLSLNNICMIQSKGIMYSFEKSMSQTSVNCNSSVCSD